MDAIGKYEQFYSRISYTDTKGRLATACYDNTAGIWQLIPKAPGTPIDIIVNLNINKGGKSEN